MHFLEKAIENKLDALYTALCTPTSEEFKTPKKHKEKSKAVESVQTPKPRKKLRFQRYKDLKSQIKGIDILKLYFFSKVAENAEALLKGENI